jgi:hypothetical protein
MAHLVISIDVVFWMYFSIVIYRVLVKTVAIQIGRKHRFQLDKGILHTSWDVEAFTELWAIADSDCLAGK